MLSDVFARRLDTGLERRAAELDLGAVVARRVDLRHRRVLRHEDARDRADLACRPRDCLPVVAGARSDDAGRTLGRVEP